MNTLSKINVPLYAALQPPQCPIICMTVMIETLLVPPKYQLQSIDLVVVLAQLMQLEILLLVRHSVILQVIKTIPIIKI